MTHGGKRKGAGRPPGKNKYGEPTKPLRIPLSKVSLVKALVTNDATPYELPLFSSKVRAGFPSPADDYIECKLDLNSHLVKHPAATFLVRAEGDSMKNAGIYSGDMLIVDKSIEPLHGKIVIAAVDGELTVKRLHKTLEKTMLLAENPKYKPIVLNEEQDVIIWGVVTHVIHNV